MTYEEKYWELAEAMNDAFDAWFNSHDPVDKAKWQVAREEFIEFSVLALEHIMDENAEVLRRMKWED